MGMDEYIIGKPDPDIRLSGKSTFCYYLENGLLSDFGGIAGTPADKFGIYFDKENLYQIA